jgi:hypothetical protein
MLARGLSVRDIEDAFKDESGRLLMSKTAVSQLGERLWDDYQAFAKRDLSEYAQSYFEHSLAVARQQQAKILGAPRRNEPRASLARPG